MHADITTHITDYEISLTFPFYFAFSVPEICDIDVRLINETQMKSVNLP